MNFIYQKSAQLTQLFKDVQYDLSSLIQTILSQNPQKQTLILDELGQKIFYDKHQRLKQLLCSEAVIRIKQELWKKNLEEQLHQKIKEIKIDKSTLIDAMLSQNGQAVQLNNLKTKTYANQFRKLQTVLKSQDVKKLKAIYESNRKNKRILQLSKQIQDLKAQLNELLKQNIDIEANFFLQKKIINQEPNKLPKSLGNHISTEQNNILESQLLGRLTQYLKNLENLIKTNMNIKKSLQQKQKQSYFCNQAIKIVDQQLLKKQKIAEGTNILQNIPNKYQKQSQKQNLANSSNPQVVHHQPSSKEIINCPLSSQSQSQALADNQTIFVNQQSTNKNNQQSTQLKEISQCQKVNIQQKALYIGNMPILSQRLQSEIILQNQSIQQDKSLQTIQTSKIVELETKKETKWSLFKKQYQLLIFWSRIKSIFMFLWIIHTIVLKNLGEYYFNQVTYNLSNFIKNRCLSFNFNSLKLRLRQTRNLFLLGFTCWKISRQNFKEHIRVNQMLQTRYNIDVKYNVFERCIFRFIKQKRLNDIFTVNIPNYLRFINSSQRPINMNSKDKEQIQQVKTNSIAWQIQDYTNILEQPYEKIQSLEILIKKQQEKMPGEEIKNLMIVPTENIHKEQILDKQLQELERSTNIIISTQKIRLKIQKQQRQQQQAAKLIEEQSLKSLIASSCQSNSQLLDKQLQSQQKQQNNQIDVCDKSQLIISQSQFDKCQFSSYEIQISIQNTKFKGENHQLAKLCFINSCQIVKYISQLSRSNKIKYIAKHQSQQTVLLDHNFKVKVQKGIKVDFDDIQDKIKKSKYALRWIIDIALGILQMEQFCIYHADLKKENTIFIMDNNFEQTDFYFKIIDFDIAFKIAAKQKSDESFKSTKQLIIKWLKSKQDDLDFIQHMFKGASPSLIQKLLNIKKNATKSRFPDIWSILYQHMKKSHIDQFSVVVQSLLSNLNIADPSIADQIQIGLKKVRENQITLEQFANIGKKLLRQIQSKEQQ